MNRGSRYPRKPGVILLCGGFITLLFCLASIYRPSLLSLVGLKVYDSMVRALPQSMEKNGPVVIDLDEKSLAEFGQWPWPRYRVAQLLDKLNSLEPKAVGLDILFAEPDRTSLHVLQQELKRDFDATMAFEGSPLLPVNNDLALAQSLLQGPFVSGFKFFFDGDVIPGRDHLLHPIDMFISRVKVFWRHPTSLRPVMWSPISLSFPGRLLHPGFLIIRLMMTAFSAGFPFSSAIRKNCIRAWRLQRPCRRSAGKASSLIWKMTGCRR